MDGYEDQMSTSLKSLSLINRSLRICIGVVMLAFGYFVLDTVENVFLGAVISLLSEYLLLTSMLGWDPLYQLAGSNLSGIWGIQTPWGQRDITE